MQRPEVMQRDGESLSAGDLVFCTRALLFVANNVQASVSMRERLLDPNIDYFPRNDPPSMGLTQPIYGYLLLTSYDLIISITIIMELNIGPRCQELETTSALCRYFAVLQVARPELFDLPILTSLFSAGLTFSPLSHPDGTHLITKC